MITTGYKGFTVQEASRAECLDILVAPAVLESFELGSAEELPAYLDTCTDPFLLLTYRKYKLIFTYFERTAGVYEVHIACPQDSKVASRVLSSYIVQWMFEHSGLEPKAITTNCPEGKIANMLRKIGATELNTDSELVYFITTAEQHRAHKTHRGEDS